MNFDDQDWEEGEPSSRDLRARSTAWKVAAGVAAGIVLGGMLAVAFDRYATQRARSEGVQSFEQTVRGTDPAVEREPRESPRQLADQVDAGVLRDQQAQQLGAEQQRAADASQRAALEQAKRKAEASQRAVQHAAERKDRDWARFYTKPAHCDDNPSKATMVECANHFIRAKRQFEEMHAAGKR